MALKKSFDEAMVAVKKLRADKLKRRGSTGRGMLTVEIDEKDLSASKVKKALSRALLKKIT